MAVQTKQLKQVSFFGVARDKTATPLSTTLTAAAAAGATTLTVAAITNAAVGDLIRVGVGEDVELCQVHTSTAPTGTTITLNEPLKKAHANAEPVVEQLLYDLGDVAEEGVEFSFNGEAQRINVATKRLTYTILTGFIDAGMKMSFPNLGLHGFATALQLPFARIRTNGAVLAVTSIIEDGNNFGNEVNQSLVCISVREDGTVLRAELWGVDFDYTGLSIAMARGQKTGVQLRALGGGGGCLVDASTYNIDTSVRPTKGKVFDAITEVGYFLVGGAATTVASGGAIDTNTVVLTSAAGLAAGKWVKYGVGEAAEYHQIDSISVNTLTNRTPFLRSTVAAVAAVEVTPTPFSGVSVAGATFSTAGTITTKRIATRRLSIGFRRGAVNARLTFALTDMSLAVFLQSLGLPAGALASGRLTITDLIATNPIDGVYAKGTWVDGTTFWVLCAGCSQDLANWLVNFTNAGDPPTQPLALEPGSHFSLLNHV